MARLGLSPRRVESWLCAALLMAGVACTDPAPSGIGDGTVEDSAGGSDTVTSDVLKTPTLKATVKATPASGNAPLDVTLEVVVDGAPKSELFAIWDFGDGEVSDPYDLGESGSTVTHQYLTKGVYEVRAMVSWKPKPKVAFADGKTSIVVSAPAALSIDPDSDVRVKSPLVVAPGDDVTVTFAVKNDGDEILQPFDVAVLLSLDDVVDDTDILGIVLAQPGMAAGQPKSSYLDYGAIDAGGGLGPVHFAVPAGVADGTYYVLVIADKGQSVNEVDRTDNLRKATDVITVNTAQAAKPDLTVTAPVFDSTKTYSPGDPLNYSQTVSNIGQGEAKQVKYAVFLSDDEALDYDPLTPDAGDLMLTSLGNSTLLKLSPGATLPLTYSLQLPKTLPDGNYFLIAKIDVLDKIEETDEGNNIAVTQNTLTVKLVVKQGQDLGLLSMTVQPKGTYLNGTVSVKYHVKNLGTAPSSAFPATIYFCNGKAFTEETCALNKTAITINPLAVGEELTDAKIVTINPSMPVSGGSTQWFIYMRLDPANTITELDETNNVKVFDNLIITATANVDVWPSDIGFHPNSVQAGGQLKISYAVHNDGTTGSGASTTWIALSGNGVCSAAAVTSGQSILLKKVVFGGVDGLDVAQLSDVVTVPASLDHKISAYTLCIILDGDNVLDKDKNKGNNAAGSTGQVTVLNPKGGCYEDPGDQAPAANDTLASAAPLPADPTALLGSCGNEDWYKVDVQKGFTLIVSMDVTAPLWTTPVPSDLDIDLIAPDGKTVVDSQTALTNSKKASALTVPAFGTYYVRVYPHVPNAKAQYKLNVQKIAPPQGTDLYAATVTAAPAVTFPGGLVKVKFQGANLGGTPAGDVGVRFVLSADLAVDASDTVLLETTSPAVGAAGAFTVESALILPVVPGGTWYVLAILDPSGLIAETNEANNQVNSNPIHLSTTAACETDAFSGNHTVDDAATLAPLTAKHADLNVCQGLEDWFRVDVPDGKAFIAKLGWDYAPGKGLLGVQILDASKTAIIAGSVVTSNTEAKLPYVQIGGTFYVHVYVLPESGQALPKAYDLDITVAEPDPSDVCLPDYYEPNNSWQSGQLLGCGTATQTLCLADEDWFHLTMAAGEVVVLGLDNPAFVLKVYGDPQKPALQTLGAPGQLTFTAADAGTYHIQVGFKSPGLKPASFKYIFKVDGGMGVDLISAIDSVFPPQVVQGEAAYLQVTLSNECKDVASAFSYAYYYSKDNTLDASDVLLGEHLIADGLQSKSKAQRDDKVIVPLSATPGPAFLLVTADSKNTVVESQELNNSAAESVTVVPLCLGDALEPNGSPVIAKPLPLGRTENLSLCPYDLDWYEISLQAGETLTVTLAFDQAAGDLDMRLYKVGQFGQAIAVAATKKSPEQLTYVADESTKYYIRVDGFNGEANSYTLLACAAMGQQCLECLTASECPVGGVCDVTSTTCTTCTPGSLSDCLDGDPCTQDACDAVLGCLHLAADATCTDGLLCTVGDVCFQGVCLAGGVTDCDDDEVCTTDSCDPQLGCQNVPNTGPCSDGDACTLGDACGAGACVAGSGAPNCVDANPCTNDTCLKTEGCTHIDLTGTPCDDGDACLLGEACSGGVCLSGSATPDCDDGDQCTTDACDPSAGCTSTPHSGACEDGDACTLGDACALGACLPGSQTPSCDDGNACTTDSCDPDAGCVYGDLSGTPCDDGDACHLDEICGGGVCLSGSATPNCDDGDQCTNDACEAKTGCVSTPHTGGCQDGDNCTIFEACIGGICKAGYTLTCVDGEVCTSDACAGLLGCTYTPVDNQPCTDGLFCTTQDTCTGGKCTGTTGVKCDDSVACTLDLCDEVTGCTHPPASTGAACENGGSCDAGNCIPPQNP